MKVRMCFETIAEKNLRTVFFELLLLSVLLRGKTPIHVYTSDFWKNCVSVYATALFHRGAVGPCNWNRLGPMTGTGDWDRRLGPTTGTDE